MDNFAIQRIQQRVFGLLPESDRSLLGTLLRDSCSEVARVVADWIREVEPSSRLMILNGINVCGTTRSHDIVAVIDLGGNVSIIDPTIWQFFPEAESILVSRVSDLGSAVEKIETKYGGNWAISEEFSKLSKEDEEKYRAIIVQNAQEN
jgi:hypothetical protein